MRDCRRCPIQREGFCPWRTSHFTQQLSRGAAAVAAFSRRHLFVVAVFSHPCNDKDDYQCFFVRSCSGRTGARAFLFLIDSVPPTANRGFYRAFCANYSKGLCRQCHVSDDLRNDRGTGDSSFTDPSARIYQHRTPFPGTGTARKPSAFAGRSFFSIGRSKDPQWSAAAIFQLILISLRRRSALLRR